MILFASIGAALVALPLVLVSIPLPRPPQSVSGPPSRPATSPASALRNSPADSKDALSHSTDMSAEDAGVESIALREHAAAAPAPQTQSVLPQIRIIDDQTGSSPAEPGTKRPSPVDDDISILKRSDGLASTQPIDRSADRRSARIHALGGTIDTENAVEAGLIWLAAHQSDDGRWDRVNYRLQCPKDAICAGWALNRTGNDLDPGVTGLCLLAFLGAGYSDRSGPHQATVQRGVAALLRMQQADGGFSGEPRMAGYNNAIATLALAEFYGLTREPLVYEPLKKAVERIESSQQQLGGWDYEARLNTGRNDTSISGWMVQALQAAASAGIPIARRSLIKAAFHVARATNNDGRGRGRRILVGRPTQRAGVSLRQFDDRGWVDDAPVAWLAAG